MKATWNHTQGHININDRKEDKFYKQLTGLVYDTKRGDFREVVVIRFYRTDARNYACAWCYSPYTAGSAHAGGGGYDREGAAAQAALSRAGITLDHYIAGSALLREAVEAVCEMQFPGMPRTVVEAYA